MDAENFKQLLAQGKEQEAREWLEQFLAEAVSPREQGQAIIAMAVAHMEAVNTINSEYIKILKNALAESSGLQRQENQIVDAIKLIKARTQISQSKPKPPVY